MTYTQRDADSSAIHMLYSGTTRMYPDLSSGTNAGTTTQANGSLHKSGSGASAVGKAVNVYGVTIMTAPASLATITIGHHGNTSSVRVIKVPSTIAVPAQLWLGNDDGAGGFDNGLSVVSDVALELWVDWKLK